MVYFFFICRLQILLNVEKPPPRRLQGTEREPTMGLINLKNKIFEQLTDEKTY